ASRTDLGIELLTDAVRLRELAGDDLATVASITRLGDAYTAARRREEGVQILEAAVQRFADLEDDARMADLLATTARVELFTADHERSKTHARDALARAER